LLTAALVCAACVNASHPVSTSNSSTPASDGQAPGRDLTGGRGAGEGAAGSIDAGVADADTVDGDGTAGSVRGDAIAVEGAVESSDADDSEGGAHAPWDPQIADALHQTACRREVRCGKQATLADCLASTMAPLRPQLVADLGAGTVSYDAQGGQALLDWIANMPCGRSAQISTTAVTGLRSHCAAAFRGTVTLGGSCQIDDECSAGLVCSTVQGGLPNQPGRCAAASFIPDGDFCAPFGAPCGPASYCDRIHNAGNPVCAPLPTASGQDCEVTITGPGCANGLVCLSTNAHEKGICGTLSAEGAPCSLQNGCEDPTNYCDATSTCVQGLGRGAACDPRAVALPSGECRPYLFCDRTSNVCVARAGPGGVCAGLSGAPCLGDLICGGLSTCDFAAPPYTPPDPPELLICP
jgi:hypothetical protein